MREPARSNEQYQLTRLICALRSADSDFLMVVASLHQATSRTISFPFFNSVGIIPSASVPGMLCVSDFCELQTKKPEKNKISSVFISAGPPLRLF